MNSSVRVIAALIIMVVVLFSLFHGSVASMQPKADVQSTLQPSSK